MLLLIFLEEYFCLFVNSAPRHKIHQKTNTCIRFSNRSSLFAVYSFNFCRTTMINLFFKVVTKSIYFLPCQSFFNRILLYFHCKEEIYVFSIGLSESLDYKCISNWFTIIVKCGICERKYHHCPNDGRV